MNWYVLEAPISHFQTHRIKIMIDSLSQLLISIPLNWSQGQPHSFGCPPHRSSGKVDMDNAVIGCLLYHQKKAITLPMCEKSKQIKANIKRNRIDYKQHTQTRRINLCTIPAFEVTRQVTSKQSLNEPQLFHVENRPPEIAKVITT